MSRSMHRENDMCKRHSDAIGAMRTIRNSGLARGAVAVEERRAYRQIAASAMSLAECIDKPQIFEPERKKLEKAFGDLAFPRYDPMQDRWWIEETADGKEYLSALRMITLQELRGAVSGKQDTFHVLQTFKARFYDMEGNERQKLDFVSPAYGAVDLLDDELGVVLRHYLAKNRNLSPVVDADRLVLRQAYDWYPDAGEAGIKQVEKLVEAAGKLGYPYVEFYLPSEISYSDLIQAYGDRLVSRQENADGKAKYIGRVATGVANGEAEPSRLLAVEHGISLLTDLFKGDELVDLNGAKFACFADSLGFTQRVVAAVQSETYVVAFGLYLPKLGAVFEKSGEKELVTGLGKKVVETGPNIEAIHAHLAETGQKLGSTYNYAMIYTADAAGGKVESADLASEQPKWSDF